MTASDDRTARVWEVSWGVTIRRDELMRRVCAEKLLGAQTFTIQDATDSILSGLAGTNPCERRGPLSATYWTNLGREVWTGLRSALFR